MAFIIFFSGKLFFIVPSLSNINTKLACCKLIFLKCRNASWKTIKISARKTLGAILFTASWYQNLEPIPKLLVILTIAKLIVAHDDNNRMAIAKKRHELYTKRNYVKTGEWEDPSYDDVDYTTTIKFVLVMLLALGVIKLSVGPEGLKKIVAWLTWDKRYNVDANGNKVP